jgi:hypothetical protein
MASDTARSQADGDGVGVEPYRRREVAVDDDSGWTEILVEGWGPLVRAAVIERVEAATLGERGMLVRTLADPDSAPAEHIERLHALVVEAIAVETGADLHELGSQAAWATYDETWEALGRRWETGGTLASVEPGNESAVAALLRALPVEAAAAGGCAVGAGALGGVEPLWVAGRMRVDVEGLWAHAALAEVPLSTLDHRRVQRIARLVSTQ